MADVPIYADETMPRTHEERPEMRRSCPCCGETAQYVGLAGGVAMTFGCRWRVRKWVQGPDGTPGRGMEDADG